MINCLCVSNPFLFCGLGKALSALHVELSWTHVPGAGRVFKRRWMAQLATLPSSARAERPLSLPLVLSLCGPLRAAPAVSRSVSLTPSRRWSTAHLSPGHVFPSSLPHQPSSPPASAEDAGAARCPRGPQVPLCPSLVGSLAQAEQEPLPPCPQPTSAVQHVPGKTAPPRCPGHTASGAVFPPQELGE